MSKREIVRGTSNTVNASDCGLLVIGEKLIVRQVNAKMPVEGITCQKEKTQARQVKRRKRRGEGYLSKRENAGKTSKTAEAAGRRLLVNGDKP